MQDDPTQLIRGTLDADGVLVATIDMPGRTMNVFSDGLMDALDALMDRVDADAAVRSVVLTSGKPTFLAGADLTMVRGYTDAAAGSTPDQMFELCGRLGRQFVRLEASGKPWVAAVNGIALGGGLELALACRARYVADDARIQIGVPEVRWGLLPGAGGTQRLPRLAPFEPAMDMLLSGKPISPVQAVERGIFTAAVPAAQLLDVAKAAARAQHGQPYDAARKFGRLAQADLPAWSEDSARALAARHGVDAERFERYPAHRAICDAVLKGARLPLAEANAVEMRQFLRLMFNPVAGRMIRSLFLERLRADKELAAPAGTALERVEHGPISAARQDWAAAFGKARLVLAANAQLGDDVVELIDASGARARLALRVLGEAPAATALPQLVLAPAGPYGRVLEVVAAPGPAAALAAALGPKLYCLPWTSPGPTSVLQQLRVLELPEQARLARELVARANAGDPVFLDVAACLSGVSPAWSGGPLVWAQTNAAAH